VYYININIIHYITVEYQMGSVCSLFQDSLSTPTTYTVKHTSSITISKIPSFIQQPMIPSPPMMESFLDLSEETSCIDSNYNEIVKDRTVIIFDWDDTIMCTTFMTESNIDINSEFPIISEHLGALDLLSKSIIDTINNAKLYGEVVIVTNAGEGWVQLSAQKFMPRLLPILKTLRVFSARNNYEQAFPDNPYAWKYMTMEMLLANKRYNDEDKKNIISVGDSLVERLSLLNVTKNIPNTLSKSVKFSEKSSIDALILQLDLLRTRLQFIVEHDGYLDLQLTLRPPVEVKKSEYPTGA